ncbi:MAG: hypothetical protein WDW38_004948 [Sanguina aurantia]
MTADSGLTDRPMIGILTQPGDVAYDGESYISAGYVKWLESAGARIVPIPYDLEPHETRHLWFTTLQLLFDLTVEANDAGQHVPMHGTCLGLEALMTVISRDGNLLESVDSENHPATLTFTPEAANSSLLSAVSRRVIDNLAKEPIAFHNHGFAMTEDGFASTPALPAFFKVLSHSFDFNGKQYISIIEGRKYPFTGFAFHPEKTPYEFTPLLHIPHSPMAVEMSAQLANAFVSQARMNGRQGRNVVEEDCVLIYNFTPEFYGRHDYPEQDRAFEQVYIFEAQRYRGVVAKAQAAQTQQLASASVMSTR